MIANLPGWIEILFLITCVVTIVLFFYSNGKPILITTLIIIWCIVHSFLAYNGFYQITDTLPPRFIFILIPPILLIIYGSLPKQIELLTKKRNTVISTFLHFVRFPVEIVLLYLFLNKMIPELMTFEGKNFDILTGLTAPVFGILYLKNIISKKILIIWNIAGLILVSTIVIISMLSAELPIQLFAFDQPNRGVSYFSFVLLPAMIVPIAMYAHITDIILLRKELQAVNNENDEDNAG